MFAIDRAVKVFDEEGVSLIVHAGDWNAPFSLARLAKAKAKIVGVFGNVDGEREHLKTKAQGLGVDVPGDFGEVEVEGVKIAIIHGKDERLVEALARSGDYAVVVRGHAHHPSVKRIGPTLILNPGEACGYLSGRRTVAILDTSTMEAKIIDI